MMIYFIPMVVLLAIWAIFTVGAIIVGLDDGIDKDEWQIVAALSTAALFGIVFWPIALPLAVVAGICYGLYCVVKVAGRLRRGEI